MKAGELFQRLMEIPCGDEVRFHLRGKEYEIECVYDHCEGVYILEAGCEMPDDDTDDDESATV